MTNMTIGGDYNLRLTSKKLNSGKCQVKFYAAIEKKKNLYGYILADAGESLKDVVVKIINRLHMVKARDNFHHINLYTIGKRNEADTNFILFDN